MTLKRVFFIGFVTVCLVIIYNLIVSTYELWHKQDVIKSENARLSRNVEENKNLKEELKTVKSKEFIESEARNKLFLVKPGESEIIMPAPSTSSSAATEIQLPNWKKWLDLFLPGVK